MTKEQLDLIVEKCLSGCNKSQDVLNELKKHLDFYFTDIEHIVLDYSNSGFNIISKNSESFLSYEKILELK